MLVIPLNKGACNQITQRTGVYGNNLGIICGLNLDQGRDDRKTRISVEQGRVANECELLKRDDGTAQGGTTYRRAGYVPSAVCLVKLNILNIIHAWGATFSGLHIGEAQVYRRYLRILRKDRLYRQ